MKTTPVQESLNLCLLYYIVQYLFLFLIIFTITDIFYISIIKQEILNIQKKKNVCGTLMAIT